MQAQEIIKMVADANKYAYDNTMNAVSTFQERAEEAMKAAFDKSPVPKEAKDSAMKTIEAYKVIVKKVLDNTKAGYENMVKTMIASQEKAEKMVRESFEKSPIPEEAKKAIFATMDAYKESCTQIQKFFEENYAYIEKVVETKEMKETEEIIEA